MLQYTSRFIHYHLTLASSRCYTTLAIARGIPDSFVNAVTTHHSPSICSDNIVSLEIARRQHDNYLSELRRHVPTLCLPPLEEHPDCVFVEDTVVAIGDTAVITNQGHLSRRGEVDSIKTVLEQLGLKNIFDMRQMDNTSSKDEIALCDGGDVLYTGRHLFVGISDRTNQSGFDYLEKVFGDSERKAVVIPVPPVIQGKHVLHLKSAITHLDEHTLLVPEGSLGDEVVQSMRLLELGYAVIRLPDVLSCNAVVVNRHVVAQDTGCHVTKERIEQACKERNLILSFVDTSELAKKDAALTCCSVLLSL